MEFELEKGKNSFQVRMELYESIANIEEIVRKFNENDILHIFINPIYVKIRDF